MEHENLLKKANESYRRNDFTKALDQYLEFIYYNQEIGRYALYNINLITKKVKKESGSIYLIASEQLEQNEWNDFIRRNINKSFFLIDIEESPNIAGCDLKSIQYSESAKPKKLLDLVVYNPMSEVLICGENPVSILIALIYKIIWNSNVYIYKKPYEKSERFEKYYNIESTIAQIAISICGLHQHIISLVELVVLEKKLKPSMHYANYSTRFPPYEKLFNELTAVSNDEYLVKLFKFTLGRAPNQNEFDHFLDLMVNNGVTRSKVSLIVTLGLECINYNNEVKIRNKKIVIQTPIIGEALPENILINECTNPVVSVLIPVYGKVEFTLACLESIANTSESTEFEILVLDDRSPDNTIEEIKKIKNVRLIENNENLGFLNSCNNGARFAKGKYIHFLNNDTVVKPGWLDNLVKTFEIFPSTGLAGSKLLYPDGSLQEAGGIIWQDGSAWNYGNKDNSLLPKYNYAREVDYISGASIMIPRLLFEKLGGFDEIYAPAYCEDSDIALKIRDSGYRVIYQPMSEVVHFEGITSGTDTGSGIKAYQVNNSKTLYERWKHRLAKHRENGINSEEEKDRAQTRRVLVLDHCTPTPDQDAGSVTVLNILLLLREMGYQVTFIPEDNFLYMPQETVRLQRAGIEVLYAPYTTSVEQHLEEIGTRYELVFMFRPGVVERNINNVRKYCPNSKVLYHTVDLHFLRMSREAELHNDKKIEIEAEFMKIREFDAIKSVDATIVHSTAELEILEPSLPNSKIFVFPLIMNIKGVKNNYKNRSDILFVGGYQHTPNIDAVEYFVNEIFPLILKKLPNICFHVVGSNPPERIKALESNNIVIKGFVENLEPLMSQVRASVAPLRYGAGIKGKIGTSMSFGVPVVATKLAAEGMSLTHGENILIGDTPEEIAKHVINIYENEFLWQSVSQNSINFAEQTWGGTAAWRILNNIISELGLEQSLTDRDLVLYPSNFL
jgi:GT2 family glycosyltransferase/glycosyltransferase involved in cell wall biosynthesis